jgi:membrane protease YdiL (CAAX protease family)
MGLPLWQVMVVLLGMPAIYVANSLSPWARGLFQYRDHAFFLPFWTSIAVLHWGSTMMVLLLLKRAGRRLSDIGLEMSALRIAAMAGIPLLAGLGLTVLAETSGANQGLSVELSPVLPATRGERVFWIFISFTAGFCEELIYRGFGIRALRWRNVPAWLAVGLPNLAFFFMHGVWAMTLSAFVTIGIAGLLFSALFLWRRSLVPGICLHALIDVANIGSS